MIATDIPPWKAEYLEKKRRKEKTDEVPLWKRELLKRIHSKNQRMSEEQADIVEEHIPKVSDNIFLVHEKKYRSVPAPRVKLTKPSEIIPPKSPVPVENVIIIEKEQANDMSVNTDEDFPEEQPEKEYPSVGIVHRLMGRFQKGKSSAHRGVYHPPPYQRSKSAELLEGLTTQVTVVEKPAMTTASEATMAESVPSDACARTHPVSGNYMAPLLISSAKPFSRHDITKAKEHNFHHVEIPIRKISSSTGPRSPSFEESEKTPGHQNEGTDVDSFSADLSNLHSNREVLSPKKKVAVATAKAEPVSKEKPVESRVNLVNGDSLHSSGISASTTTKSKEVTKLQDRSNLTSYTSAPPRSKDVDVKIVPPPTRHGKVEQKTVETQSKVRPPSSLRQDSKPKPQVMKENQPASPSKTADKNKDFFKEVVNECFDDSTMKSSAAVAANRIMKTSKTFKITPKQAGQSSAKTPTARTTNAHDSRGEQISPSQPQEKAKTKVEPVPITPPRRTPPVQEKEKIEATFKYSSALPKNEPKGDLPSTSIDDIIAETPSESKNLTLLISPVTTLPTSGNDNSIKDNSNNKEKQTPTTSPVAAPRATKETEPTSVITKKPNTSPVVTKPTSNQSRAVLGPKLTSSGPKKAGFGRSFVIDPSKFRKSSAPQPTSTTAAVVRESGNTRTIVPNRSQGAAAGGEEVTDGSGKTGKRKLTVDQITVIGGYVLLNRSCLVKDNKRKKQKVTISFCEDKDLETTFTYISERSMLVEEAPTLPAKAVTKSPGFGKDSTIGKYTPKYLLSMKDNILDEEEDATGQAVGTNGDSKPQETGSQPERGSNDATPLSDDSAIAWSDTTSGSTDLLF